MSQEKAQLIAPIGIMTVSGMTATGVITATSFTGNIVGSAKSLVNGTDVTAGVVTGTSFVGNLTGNIQRLADSAPNINVGVTTATSFVGNLTGSVTDLTSQPAITVGLVTATSLSGPITGNVTGDVDGDVTGNVTGTIAGNVTGNVTGNATGTSGGLGVNYNGGWTGAGTSQVRVGVITATYFHGDGSNLDGVSSGPVSQQAVTIDGASTSIDLSSGNVIYATQSADTTVSFANTENGNVYFIRTKDDTSTARTITWPTGIGWSGGSAPTLIQDNPRTTDAQVFLLVTRDMGVTWYGKEVMRSDPQTFSLFSWGRNYQGSTGQNYTEEPRVSSPIQIGTNTNWKHMEFSYLGGSMNATKTDGTFWSWGPNNMGQLGQNDRTARSSPTQIGTDTDWNTPWGAGEYTSFCVKTDGTMFAWGYNQHGALGLNTAHQEPGSRSSPTQLPGTSWSTGIDKNAGGEYFCISTKTDGTLWSWGDNSDGQLGTSSPTNTDQSSPCQIGTDNTWTKVGAGRQTGYGIKTDGTLWAWGTNSHGVFGNNSPTAQLSSPIQIDGTTWSSVDSGYRHTGSIKTDGTLWMWGEGTNGALAQNNQTHYSSPRQVPGTTWSQVQCGREYSLAVKTDGTAWAWGQNQLGGNLGLNNTTAYSSPVQIPGTSWGLISAAYAGTFGFQKAG